MSIRARRFTSTFASALVLLVANAALGDPAPFPGVRLQGTLANAGGAPVDGVYGVTLRLYASKDATDALWQEAYAAVTVTKGLFTFTMGDSGIVKPPAVQLFQDNPNPWIGLQVGADPEMPRVPFNSSAYAHVAAIARTLQCAGCLIGDELAVGAIKPDKVNFAYAGSLSKGGPAGDLECSACVGPADLLDGSVSTVKLEDGAVTSAKLADGAVGDAQLSVKWAAADGKSGKALAAALADKATAADVAAQADKATLADKSTLADTATKLQCTGCVELAMLSADAVTQLKAPATTTALGSVIVGDNLSVDAGGKLSVTPNTYLPLAGGTVTGDLTVKGKTTVGTIAYSDSANDLRWMMHHAAAAGACAAASPVADSGIDHGVFVHPAGVTCAAACATNTAGTYPNCRTSIAIGSVKVGRAAAYTDRLASNYNYGCNDNQQGYDEVKGHGLDAGYAAYCCCYK